ncbi:TPA: hypothetical protein ACG3R3_003972 [Clostridioides difficile]
MELIEWNYAYITDLVEFANDKEIAKNLRDNFPTLIGSKTLEILLVFVWQLQMLNNLAMLFFIKKGLLEVSA